MAKWSESLMEKGKLLVRYISGYKEPDEDGIILESYKSVKIDKSYSKLYSSGLVKLSMMKGVQFTLFMFLCEISKNDGLVWSEKHYYDEFKKWIKRGNNEPFPYTTSTIRKAYAELTKIELLIKLNRGAYRINPVHYWKGSGDHDRVAAVKSLLEGKVIEPWYTDNPKKKDSNKSKTNISFDIRGINFDDDEIEE
ncbi:hypothetical protein [Algoriphagus antarcticus]|uniref:Uncharacterized protein n=1 Tax=Algoriphagus antarcticus TaxID=238540 RepID=A0A3E0E1T8_9BACT|nr:hypothetical protein [Algoriphagus antarcticus]REG92145.1 hypothetical protein C8N25_103224 [Algoriphagus antarcticus]